MREQQYGKYLLLDRIAVGGMAEIFLPRQIGPEGFEKTVVVKRIRPHLGDKKSIVRMFLNEAKLAAQLTHPNIIQIHDLGKVGDSDFIAMEYLFGRDMRRVLPKCEQEGISFDGGVEVLDFGIAKAANQVEMTRAGKIKGKLSYMSPEQCMGKPLDHRSDIFSLGVVLYEWITGFKPFTGESDAAVLKSITDGKIYKPSYFKAEVPEQIEQILMRALEKDPNQRYQTAWEMQYDLDKFLASNEFTPSNQHLATFMRQLFADEMDAERARLSGSPEVQRLAQLDVDKLTSEEDPSGPRYLGIPTPRQDTLPGRGQAPKVPDATGDTLIEVPLQAGELEQLAGIASRNAISVQALVDELLQSFLRFR